MSFSIRRDDPRPARRALSPARRALLGACALLGLLASGPVSASPLRDDPSPATDFSTLPPTVQMGGGLTRVSELGLALPLVCTGTGPCAGTVQVLWRRPVPGSGGSRTHTVELGHASFSAHGGDDVSVPISLNGRGRSALRAARAHPLHVSARVTLTDGFAISAPAVLTP